MTVEPPREVPIGEDGRVVHIEPESWSPGRRLTKVGFWPLFCWENTVDGDQGQLWIVDLIIVFGYRRGWQGQERDTSVLGLFHWSGGQPELEEVR